MVSTLAPFMALPSCRLAVVMRRVALYCPASLGAFSGRTGTHTRYGYTFDGWYTKITGGTEVTRDTTVATAADPYPVRPLVFDPGQGPYQCQIGDG